jgi:hypothetical protein
MELLVKIHDIVFPTTRTVHFRGNDSKTSTSKNDEIIENKDGTLIARVQALRSILETPEFGNLSKKEENIYCGLCGNHYHTEIGMHRHYIREHAPDRWSWMLCEALNVDVDVVEGDWVWMSTF